MKKSSHIPCEMTRRIRLVAVLAVGALAFLATVPLLQAIAPPDAKIIIELNATDEDVGIQLFFDGPGWIRLEVFDPDGWKIFESTASGSVQMQGGTEFFLESEEPSLDELPLDDLKARFPEGQYTFTAVTLDGQILKGKAKLTHSIPEGPDLVAPEEDAEVDPDNTVIEWELVDDPPGSKIVGYQVIVSRENSNPGLGVDNFSVDVSPTTTSVTVPAAFMESKANYKFEVLAIESSGNQTISEREFKTQ